MDKNLPGPMTPFDDLITSPELQIMKLLIPYAPASKRQMLAACVKVMELRETIRIFGGGRGSVRAQTLRDEENPSPIDLLNSFRPYLKPREISALDMILNLREMMSVMEMMQSASSSESGDTGMNPMDLLSGILSPEQQEMFHIYSDMFSQAESSPQKGDDINEWMNNPAMKNIDPAKLELIRMAASKTSGKTGKDLAPVMLALITSANRQGIQFTSDEVTLILEILKQGKSKEEQEQIDRTVQMTSSIFKRHKH